MASRLQLTTDYDVSWAGELGRRVVTGILGLAFMAAVVVSAVATDTRVLNPSAGAPAPAGSAIPTEASALRVALENVLAAATRATRATQAEALQLQAATGETGETGSTADVSAAERALEDAWLTLAVVHDRLAAQLEVAAGDRAPLTSAPPPVPAFASREIALVRSAMSYVRGAIEARDLTAVARAHELLALAKA